MNVAETTPGQKRRFLVEQTNPARHEIRDMLTGPISLFAERVERFAKEHPGDVNRLAHWHAADRVPYAVASLPPDFNDPFRSRGYQAPPIPQSEDDLKRAMREYWPIRFAEAPVTSPGVRTVGPEHRADLEEELRRMRQRGDTIDPGVWQEYEQVHRTQQERAREGRGICSLHNNSAFRTSVLIRGASEDRGLFDQATGTYDNFLIAPTSSPYGIITPIRAPIGEYGEPLAKKLLRTWAFLVDFAGQDNVVLEAFAKQIAEHRKVTDQHIFRSMDAQLPGAEEGAISVLQEAFNGMFAMIFLHTAERMKGHEDDPDGAFRQVCQDDLINVTTGLAPLGLANPMTVHGLRFKEPNKYVDGRLTYSDDLKRRLDKMRELNEAIGYEHWKGYSERAKDNPDETPPVFLAGLCPFYGAFKEPGQDILTPGAISRLTPTIQAVYDCIDLLPDDLTGNGLPWDIPRFVEPIEQPPLPTIAGRVMWLAREGRIAQPVEREVFSLPPDLIGSKDKIAAT